MQMPPKEQKSKRSDSKKQKPKRVTVETLYNRRDDVCEQNNLLAEHPYIAARLKEQMEKFGRELRSDTRPAGIANNFEPKGHDK